MDHSVFQRCLQIFPKFDPKWRPDVQAMWWLCFDMLWAAAHPPQEVTLSFDEFPDEGL